MKLGAGSPYINIMFIAILSRTFLLLSGYLSFFLMGRYDRSTELSTNTSIFKYLLSWDAVHFLHIADNGYTHEHAMPFFPLLPYIIRQLPTSNNLTKAVLFNNVIFILSAMLLYKISLKKYSRRTSLLAVHCFIFNPAAIIYSVFYTEALFAFLFFMAYYYLQSNRQVRAVSMLMLCGMCRSNSLLFLMFVKAVWFLPVLFFTAGFQLYCLLRMVRNTCNFRIFVPYSYIQAEYWDQGFMKFYRKQNIANFIYGMPFVLYSIYIIYEYVKSRIFIARKISESHKIARSLDNDSSIFNTDKDNPKTEALSIKSLLTFKNLLSVIRDPLFSEKTTLLTKLVIILGIQTLMLIFLIHWNTAARFISYNPFLYWAFAFLIQNKFHSTIFRFSTALFLTYTLLYAIFFSCFYPPA